MHGAAKRVHNHEQPEHWWQLKFCTKMMVGPRTRPDHGYPQGNKVHGRKKRSRFGWVSSEITNMVNTTPLSTAKDQ